MPDFWKVFPKGNVFLVVIHAVTKSQTLENIKIAHQEGADGVFLISHGAVSGLALLRFYRYVRTRYPSWWIGMNFLDHTASDALRMIPESASGLWVDDAGINEHAKDPCESAKLLLEQRKQRVSWQGLYFGGVAFKYQQQVNNVAHVAQLAVPYMDVITTSGDATGQPPTVEKIWAMRNTIGDHPLAVASGITPENVDNYLGAADAFLVATGISSSLTELDPARVRKLAQIIHSS